MTEIVASNDAVAYQLGQQAEMTAPLIILVTELAAQQMEMLEMMGKLIGPESVGKGDVEDEPVGTVGNLRRALEHRLKYGAMLNRQLHVLVANFE